MLQARFEIDEATSGLIFFFFVFFFSFFVLCSRHNANARQGGVEISGVEKVLEAMTHSATKPSSMADA